MSTVTPKSGPFQPCHEWHLGRLASNALLCAVLIFGVQSPTFAQFTPGGRSNDSGVVRAMAVVERSLRSCNSSYVVHRNRLPYAEDRDFCTVPPNDRIGGEDVSKRDGRQLDAIDVIRQLQWFIARNHNAVSGDGRYRATMRALSNDLEACLSFFNNYRDGWGHSSGSQPDYCEFAAGRPTRPHYPNRDYSGSPNRYSLREVVAGGARVFRELRDLLRQWGFE